MAIKIQTEKPVIPVEIGDLTFEFEITDENIQRLYDTHEEVRKGMEKIEGEDFQAAQKVLKKALDFLLGEGSFDKLYEMSPSVIVVTKYFWAIVEGLEEELLKKVGQTSQQKAQKYIRNKEENR